MGISALHSTTAQQIGLRTAGPTTIEHRQDKPGSTKTDGDSKPTSLLSGSDSVQISAQGRAAAAAESEHGNNTDQQDTPKNKDGQSKLSEEEQKAVTELKQRDREVRAHENAHKAAAGSLAKGGPTYTTQRGPDGKQYAVGGEVNIQLSKGSTPEQTLQTTRQAQAAANAPSDPSSQDRKVAAQAAAMASEARAEIAAKKRDGGDSENESTAAEGLSGDLIGSLVEQLNQEPSRKRVNFLA